MDKQTRFSPWFSVVLTLSACDAPITSDGSEPFDDATSRSWDSEVSLRGADPFQIRGESKLGCRNEGHLDRSWASSQGCAEVDELDVIDPLTNSDRYILLRKDTNGFVPIPRMKTKFQVEDATTPIVAITFSTMAHALEQNVGSAKVRLLIDGQDVADPGAVTFWSNRADPHRWAPTAFTFLVEASPGVHTVELQYESTGSSIHLRDASLRVDVERWVPGETPNYPVSHEGVFAESSILNSSTQLPQTWKKLPGGGLDFNTGSGTDALLVLSPTLKSTGGDFAIRAVVDGVPASPAQFDFDGDQELAARSVSFMRAGLGAGSHHVDWEWKSTTSNAATVRVEALTELALVGPRSDSEYVLHARRQSDGMTMIEDDNFMVDEDGWWWPIDPYRPIPGLETEVDLDEISDAAISVSVHLSGDRVVFVAPTLDGEVLRDQEIMFGAEAERNDGPRTYTFAVKDIPAGAATTLGLAARSASGNPVGQSLLTAGVASFQVKRRVGPDLAVGAKSGARSISSEAIIEPVAGPRRVLAIALDTQRDDAVVASQVDFENMLAQSLTGGDPSVANYLDVMSGGRVSLVSVKPPKLYTGVHPGGDDSTNYYWDNAEHDCNNGSTYRRAANARWATALLAADADVAANIDFSSYDDDKDNVLEAHELGIIVYSVDDGIEGSTLEWNWNPRCDNDPFMLDGVRIREFANVSIPPNSDTSDATKTKVVGVTTHELGHLLLYLDDLKVTVFGSFDEVDGSYSPDCSGMSCETRRMNTDPYRMALMSAVVDASLPHLTAFEKLQLGWATPRIPTEGGLVSLPDVAESEDVVILPRRNSDAKEYFMLEARFSEFWGSTKYDMIIGGSGLAPYHIIEPSQHCFEGDLANCRPLASPPQCVPADVWELVDNHARAGIRMLQETLVYTDSEDETHLFNGGEDLYDEAAGGGLTCPDPSQIGVVGGTSHLVWSDGTPSGYQALDVTAADPTVDFDLVVP